MLRKVSGRGLSFALALGAFGGAVLVLSLLWFVGRRGSAILLPYAAVVLGMTVAIRAERFSHFAERFLVGLLAFMIASIALYVAVVVRLPSSGIPVWAHAWRLAFLVGLGVAINLPAARLAAPPPTSSS
jgi:hypothetical protein